MNSIKKLGLAILLLVSSQLWAQQATDIDSVEYRTAFFGVNLNAANTDNAINLTLPRRRYIVRRVTLINASVNLSASSATVGVFAGAGGTGTTVVAATTIKTLTSPPTFLDMTIAATTGLNAQTLFVRVGTAHGSAATVDVYIELQPIY